MSVSVIVANRFMYYLVLKKFDLSTDDIRCCLMQSGFVFDRDNHHNYADIAISELVAGYGYETGGKSLTDITVVEDDEDDKTIVSFGNISWVASGGSIGPTDGAILYDASETNKSLIGYLGFDTNYTIVNEAVFNITNIKMNIRRV